MDCAFARDDEAGATGLDATDGCRSTDHLEVTDYSHEGKCVKGPACSLHGRLWPGPVDLQAPELSMFTLATRRRAQLKYARSGSCA